MVNDNFRDLSASEIADRISAARKRADYAERLRKTDCARFARESASAWEKELEGRAQTRATLFSLGAAAVVSETGI